MKEYTFLITDLEQLDDYQQFYNELGLCQVVGIIEDPNFDCNCGYEYEVIEPYRDFEEELGAIYILAIGDKISITE